MNLIFQINLLKSTPKQTVRLKTCRVLFPWSKSRDMSDFLIGMVMLSIQVLFIRRFKLKTHLCIKRIVFNTFLAVKSADAAFYCAHGTHVYVNKVKRISSHCHSHNDGTANDVSLLKSVQYCAGCINGRIGSCIAYYAQMGLKLYSNW